MRSWKETAFEEPTLGDLTESGETFALRHGQQRREITQDANGLVEGTDQVLPRPKIDACLAADCRIHLTDEGRRHLHERETPQVRCRGEAGEVGHRSPADADDYVITR